MRSCTVLCFKQYDSLGHYTVYGVNAKDGAMRWKHEPGDFESTLPYSVEVIYRVLRIISVWYTVLRYHKRKSLRIELNIL